MSILQLRIQTLSLLLFHASNTTQSEHKVPQKHRTTKAQILV